MILVNSSQKSSYSIAFKGNVELCNSRRGLALSDEFSKCVTPHEKRVHEAKLVVGKFERLGLTCHFLPCSVPSRTLFSISKQPVTCCQLAASSSITRCTELLAVASRVLNLPQYPSTDPEGSCLMLQKTI